MISSRKLQAYGHHWTETITIQPHGPHCPTLNTPQIEVIFTVGSHISIRPGHLKSFDSHGPYQCGLNPTLACTGLDLCYGFEEPRTRCEPDFLSQLFNVLGLGLCICLDYLAQRDC